MLSGIYKVFGIPYLKSRPINITSKNMFAYCIIFSVKVNMIWLTLLLNIIISILLNTENIHTIELTILINYTRESIWLTLSFNTKLKTYIINLFISKYISIKGILWIHCSLPLNVLKNILCIGNFLCNLIRTERNTFKIIKIECL